MKLYILPLKADSWQALKEQVAACWSPQTVYVYTESLTQCSLNHLNWEAFWKPGGHAPDSAWEGRCFDQDFELRWMRQPEGYLGWLTTELPLNPQVSEAAESLLCEASVETHYYLHGQYDTTQECTQEGAFAFREERFPNKRFDYPLPQTPKAGDRAYIRVKTYERAEPDWQAADLAQANLWLDAPLLLAHRFVGLGADQTETKGATTDG